MVTLSPFCGTDMLCQFMPSDQLEPSPLPVHTWLDDALAAVGASRSAARTPVPAARVPAAAIVASLRHDAAPSRLVRWAACFGHCVPRLEPGPAGASCSWHGFSAAPRRTVPGSAG